MLLYSPAMIRAVFGSNDSDSDDWRLTLTSPTEVLAAHSISEVNQLVQAAEDAALRGSYVALMLSYEAAAAFDPALITHPKNSKLPLAWAAVFPEATKEYSDLQFVTNYCTSDWQPGISESEYRAAVEKVLELIAEGQTYQVNYSFPMTATFKGDPLAYYLDLSRAQGARYSAFLDLEDFQILSLSPELFFERKGRHVKTKPMKGTIKRGRWTSEDRALAKCLSESAKDRAENVMIVDLLRNDLGKVSQVGSVRVPALFELERFETLWQMTSTVESTLNAGAGLVQLLAALFPCGSITGAPKISTMKFIKELERFPRGIYTGAIGFLRPGGDCIFNVAIRTLQLESKTGVVTFGVGGGVTSDSTPEREYSECLVKSAFLKTPAPEFQLLESILLEDSAYFLLEGHLARLRDSAAFFGFRHIEEEITTTLNRIVAEYPIGKWKVRLLVARDGEIQTEVLKVDLQSRVRHVVLASEPLDSTNRMLFHKTTERSAYRSAATSNYDDVVFWNERGEVTESANANVVVRIDDQLWTPLVACGLLPGTFRQQLLCEGKIKERVILIEELLNATELFLINSVQKWMPASLANSRARQQEIETTN
jgi:para-aminobenzoate synthetase / 4-amino-4-deoxychorismate lyase